jgi:competence protein ComEC
MNKSAQFEFRQVPLVRLLFPYMMGIGFLYVFNNGYRVFSIITLSGIFMLIILRNIQLFHKLSESIAGTIVFAVLFWCGIFSFHADNLHAVLPKEKTTYCGLVYRQPSIKGRYYQIDCRIIHFTSKNKIINIKENVRLYYKSDSLTHPLKIGDSLVFNARMDRLKSQGNPCQFDYANFMAIDGIYYMTFLSMNDMLIGGDSRRYPVRRLASSIQRNVIEKYKKYSIKGGELAVISALVVGNTERLDGEIKGIYTASGAMHILAVSGWHIGVLFLFLNLLLGNKNQRRLYRLFRMIVILLVIWLYTFITGLSPSVLRSAVMFSLFLIGKNFGRQTNNYNILAASALIILVIDPNEMFMASFQLSYLAVLGILFFQPRLTRLLSFQNKIADNIWQLFTVSFAAQLITFPISLFYFHQFPNYFWLTNMLIIPLVWIIMVITVLFFCVLPFASAAKVVAFCLGLALKAMNFLINSIAKLPFSVIGNIRFEFFHLVLFGCLVFVITVLIYIQKKKYILPVSGLILLILLVFESINYEIDDKRKEIVIYNNEKGMAISLINGHKHLLFIDSTLFNNYTAFIQSTHYYWRYRQIERSMKIIHIDKLEIGTIIKGKNIAVQQMPVELIVDFNKKILCVQNKKGISNQQKYFPDSCLGPDLFIVSKSSEYPDKDLLQRHKIGKIVIAEEISYKKRKAWGELAINNKIEIYDVDQSGALHIVF